MTPEQIAILRNGLRDIVDAEPIPDPLAAFEWCRQVAQDALERAGVTP